MYPLAACISDWIDSTASGDTRKCFPWWLFWGSALCCALANSKPGDVVEDEPVAELLRVPPLLCLPIKKL